MKKIEVLPILLISGFESDRYFQNQKLGFSYFNTITSTETKILKPKIKNQYLT